MIRENAPKILVAVASIYTHMYNSYIQKYIFAGIWVDYIVQMND